LGALGIVSIVAFGGKPAPIADKEIEAIRKALGSGQNLEPYPYLHEGQKIRTEKGPLRGLEGILIKKRSWRIVISVQMLHRAVAVEIDPDSISPVESYDGRSQTNALSPSQGEQPGYQQTVSIWTEAEASSLVGA